MAEYLTDKLSHKAAALRDVGLRDADDIEIYEAAGTAGAILVTKDKDFVDLAGRLGPPPHVIWLTCGNTTEDRLKAIFDEHLEAAIDLIENDQEPLVEISG